MTVGAVEGIRLGRAMGRIPGPDGIAPISDSLFPNAGAGREPISPCEVRRLLSEALAVRGSDPVLAGERVLLILLETELSLRQLSVLGISPSRSTLENLVFLARLPREIRDLVRVHSLPPSTAELIGRYLGTEPVDLQVKAARSVVRHSLGYADVRRLGRIYQATREFRFPE